MNSDQRNQIDFDDAELSRSLDRCAFDEGKRFSSWVRSERVRAGLDAFRKKVCVDLGGGSVRKSPDAAKTSHAPEKKLTK